jgi:uncharacterized protein
MNLFGHIDTIILFFFLGLIAAKFKVSLRLPDSISQFLSIYLLVAIGLKGGQEMAKTQELAPLFPVAILGLAFCVLIPIIYFYVGKRFHNIHDAAAIAASYGSVSAVTFVVGQNFLSDMNQETSGFMVAVLAMMEIPSIVVSLFLYQRSTGGQEENKRNFFQAAFGHKSIFLVLGGFFIGTLLKPHEVAAINPFMKDCFKGMLALYLLDLGGGAFTQLNLLWKSKWVSILFALVFPLIFGTISLFLSNAIGISSGNAVLLSLLVGGASYIAAPAAIKIAIPEAAPSVYAALPIGITFPFNVSVGMLFYFSLAKVIF